MDWENEIWVKLYTRNTVDDALLSWEARALWSELFRRFDRSGVLDFGRHGWRGVAALVGMPADVVELAAVELLTDGRIIQREDRLVAPNYVDAQQTRQSDKLRQQESRARRRAKALQVSPTVTNGHQSGETVTQRDIESQNVTDCHQVSPGVTNGHDKKRVDESREEEKRESPARKHALPQSWQPTEKHIAKVDGTFADLEAEADNFRNWAEANGKKFVKWDAAFHNWLTRAIGYAAEREAKQPRGPVERML